MTTPPVEPLVAELAGIQSAARAYDDLDAWWADHRQLDEQFADSFDRAFVGAMRVDRLGYAFAGGYREALAALFHDQLRSGLAALAATEEGGAHPSAIRTTLRSLPDGRYQLDGTKRWTTLATLVDHLFIVASEGTNDDGKNRLRVCRVGRDCPGVRLTAMPPTSFAPEIPHAELALETVAIEASDVLPGDGWETYVKPFRTIEDIHVHAALLGYLAGASTRRGFGSAIVEELLACTLALRAVKGASASAAEAHVALGGALRMAGHVVERFDVLVGDADDDEALRWKRDRPLLRVASAARTKRLEVAWERLRASHGATR